MDQPEPDPELIQRLREQHPQAAGEVFARYGRKLVHLAERHLSRKLAGREDGEDIVQSVFRTFVRRNAAGEFQIDTTGHLWRLLVTITLLKVRAKGRHHTAQCRNVNAEARQEGEDWLAAAAAREPGPEEAAALVDLIEGLLQGWPAVFGRVLEMRLQGHEVAAIADELEVSRPTVYRVLHLLQGRLQALSGGPE
jgi:RNA polymerase sigma-70 factor (ECF subfamily)